MMDQIKEQKQKIKKMQQQWNDHSFPTLSTESLIKNPEQSTLSTKLLIQKPD